MSEQSWQAGYNAAMARIANETLYYDNGEYSRRDYVPELP